jgi:hypothetical protein
LPVSSKTAVAPAISSILAAWPRYMLGRQVTPPGHLTFEIYRAFERRQPAKHL